MRFTKVFAMLVVLLVAGSAFADTIYNINFYRLITSYSGPAVVGADGDYWNFVHANVALTATKSYTLNNAAGTASSVVLDTSAVTTNGYSSTTAQTTPILRDWWTCSTAAQVMTITGLDNSRTYDFYIYSDLTGGTSKPSITIGGQTLQATAGASSTSYILNTNYVVFEDIAPTNGTITMSFVGAAGGSPVDAIQIVQSVPEPATISLLMLGGIVAVVRKRK